MNSYIISSNFSQEAEDAIDEWFGDLPDDEGGDFMGDENQSEDGISRITDGPAVEDLTEFTFPRYAATYFTKGVTHRLLSSFL